MTARVGVMIVEDSTVVRQLLAATIARDPRLAVVSAVGSAEEALALLDRVRPDVISMDIRLPGMDGLEAIRRIMASRPTPIVVIADSVNDASLRISMNALRAGALSVVEKPVGVATEGYEEMASTICTQLYIMSEVAVVRRRDIGQPRPMPATSDPAADDLAASARLSVIGIGTSTGGPPALARVLGALPADFPLPILVVQHMGASFMEGFAAWLDGIVPPRVVIGRDGQVAQAGHVYVAPGGLHLTMTAGGILRTSAAPPLAGQRPSATLLFQSLARSVGAGAVGVLLTGMGEDGAIGLRDMREAGAYTIAEHESSAVVYGMPAAAVRLGAARVTLPLDLIGPKLKALLP